VSWFGACDTLYACPNIVFLPSAWVVWSIFDGFYSLVWTISWCFDHFHDPFTPNIRTLLTGTDGQGVRWGNTSIPIDLANSSFSSLMPTPHSKRLLNLRNALNWIWSSHPPLKSNNQLKFDCAECDVWLLVEAVLQYLLICWQCSEWTTPWTTAWYSSCQATGGCWWSQRANKSNNIHNGNNYWPK
jgi:hypothetical protein